MHQRVISSAFPKILEVYVSGNPEKNFNVFGIMLMQMTRLKVVSVTSICRNLLTRRITQMSMMKIFEPATHIYMHAVAKEHFFAIFQNF